MNIFSSSVVSFALDFEYLTSLHVTSYLWPVSQDTLPTFHCLLLQAKTLLQHRLLASWSILLAWPFVCLFYNPERCLSMPTLPPWAERQEVPNALWNPHIQQPHIRGLLLFVLQDFCTSVSAHLHKIEFFAL